VDPAHAHNHLGEFRIESVLGQGGSGIVYDATWGPRRVALKVLHPSLVGTGIERAQFLTEAQRLQQIMHPSVVKVLAVGTLPDGRPYLAMERLEGETLAGVIARGALALDRALDMFAELASAVGALHEQGLVHRDLKPENVFVVAGRHAVLLDFGIAKDLAAPASTTTQEGNVRGTPAYMAPERFFGQPAGLATDVYELALVLYVMLAGRLPWDEIADPEARLQPRALTALVDVPEALDVEIRRALSTRAQNRPASAKALLDAVREAASGSVTEPGPGETARLRPDAQSVANATTADAPAHAGRHVTHASTKTKPGAPERLTPLAWAPTLAAPGPRTAKQRTRRWPLALGIGLVAIAGAGAAWWKLGDRESGAAKAVVVPVAQRDGGTTGMLPYDPDDPWSTKPEVTKAFSLVDDEKTVDEYRAEAAAAVQRLPTDTRFVFTAQIGELRANSHTADLLDKIVKHPRVAPLALMMPVCVRSLVGDAEWLVFGAPGLDTSEMGTLILRGRWRRSDVEACFGDSVKAHVTNDGARLYRVGDTGWLDFVDDHTALVTLNTKLEPEGLHRMIKKAPGPVTRVKQIVAALPAERTIAIVADGKANDDWSMLSLPRGSDVFGWIRVEEAGLVLDLAADPHDADAANAAIRRIKPEIDSVFGASTPDAVGKLEVVRQATVVHIRGNVTSFMLGIVTASIPL
jgi:serine/threonine-protein kinase